MGTLNNIFSLVFGINLILVGLVAFLCGIVSLLKTGFFTKTSKKS